MFYIKFSIRNLKKSRDLYTPFVFAGTISVFLFYLIFLIARNESVLSTVSSDLFSKILNMGIWVSGILVCVFLFLANGYLFKNKKKALGLYNTLGMSKKQIIILSFWELLFTALLSIAFGIISGRAASILLFRCVSGILKVENVLSGYFDIETTVCVVLLFLLLYLFIWIYNSYTIMKLKTIELMKGSQIGEREPASKGLLAVVGVVLLAVGYWISACTVSPMEAINKMFIAAVLIIAGIYIVFTYTSITVLKLLKKKKCIYYKTQNFICISNLLFRMKKNAVGMASICILSTAVIAITSATVSLYAGLSEQVDAKYLRDVMVYVGKSDVNQLSAVKEYISVVLREEGIAGKDSVAFESFPADAKVHDNIIQGNLSMSFANKSYGIVRYISIEDYNKMEHTDISLDENQIMIYTNDTEFRYDEVVIDGQDYNVKKYLEKLELYDTEDFQLAKNYYIICSDEIGKMHYAKLNRTTEEEIHKVFNYGINVESEEETVLVNRINSYLSEKNMRGLAGCREETFHILLSMYSGLMFVGISFSILFIFMTAFVIYYKQISEGYEDQERFAVMKNIGLTDKEIKKVTGKQILFVFFMPVIIALVNMFFSYNVIVKCLMILNLKDTRILQAGVVITSLGFLLVYMGIYFVTTQKYISIVSGKDKK